MSVFEEVLKLACCWEHLLFNKFGRVSTYTFSKEGGVNIFLFHRGFCSDLDNDFVVIFIIKLEKCVLITNECNVSKAPSNSLKDPCFAVPCNVLLDFIGQRFSFAPDFTNMT